jgi:outer membrane protein OmpA-like peptidoglycan-associated protein
VTGGGGGLHRGRVTGRPGGAHWWGGTGPAGGGSHAARVAGRRGVLALAALLAVLAAGGIVAALVLVTGDDPAPPSAATPRSAAAAPSSAADTGTTDPLVLQQTLDEVTATTPLRFAADAATPTTGSAAAVDRLAAALTASPGPAVTVEGHSARVGEGGQRGVRLSEERAAEIARRLEAAGVPAGRLRVVGVGPARPLATLEESRRVELRVDRGVG